MYQSSQQQLVDGVVYIASQSSQRSLVLAVDTRDGHALWQHEEQSQGISAIPVCAGKLYLLGDGTKLQALRITDGRVLWSYKDPKSFLMDSVVTPQAISLLKGQLTSSGNEGVSVIMLGANTGQVLWEKSYSGHPAWSLSLLVHEQKLSVLKQVPAKASGDSLTPIASVQALDGKSGHIIWTASMPPNMEQIRAVQLGTILYLNGQNLRSPTQSLLLALNVSTGKQLWQRQQSYNQITLLGEQDLYGYKGYGPDDDPLGPKQLCSLNGMTGRDQWCVQSLQPSQFSGSSTQDILLVEEVLHPNPMTLVHSIYGIRKHDGKVLWKLPWKSSSPSVVTLTLVTVIEGQRFERVVA